MLTDGHTEEHTDMTKPAVASRNFGNAAKNSTRKGFGAILFKTRHEDGLVLGVQIVTNRGLRNFFRGFLLLSGSQSRLLVFTVPRVNTQWLNYYILKNKFWLPYNAGIF
jgi:hypothetical protein